MVQFELYSLFRAAIYFLLLLPLAWAKHLGENGNSGFTLPPQAFQSCKNSPPLLNHRNLLIDRWLGLFAAAIGIVFFLLPKTPIVIIISLVLIFILFFHPIWNFWWIEQSLMRRSGALLLLAIILIVLGGSVWPKTMTMTNEELCSTTIVFAQRIRDFDRERRRQRQQQENQFNAQRDAAKSNEEKERIGKQSSEFIVRWLDDNQYDYENRFMPQAKSLRNQLLSRLPAQPPSIMVPDEAAFMGAGPGGFREPADRLEAWAKTLCPQR